MCMQYYPPVGNSPVLQPPTFVSPNWIPGASKQPVVAPFCHTYVTGTSPLDQDEIFCRLTVPSGPTDLPQVVGDVQVANSRVGFNQTDMSDVTFLKGSVAVQDLDTFAFYICSQLQSNWFNAGSNIEGSGANYGQSGEFGPGDFCVNAILCFHSTTGLPVTPFQPSGSYTSPGGAQGSSSRHYYCCIETTRVCPETGPCTLLSVTRCVFEGTVDNSNTGTCSLDSFAETCIQTVNVDDTGASILSFSDFKCSYSCEFPCVTTTDTSSSCTLPPYENCGPSIHTVQCTSAFNQPPNECATGATLVGSVNLNLTQPVTSSFAVDIPQTCGNGQIECVPTCACYKGCPQHPTCSLHGTLYQSPSAKWFPVPLAQICSCDPGYTGDNCEFALQQTIPCNVGQSTLLT